jgi:uncharacterized membrane protein
MLSVVFFLIAYAVIGLAALPLAMRLIPPNPIYGLNTPRTRDSTTHWQNVNAVGGQLLLVCCGLAAILLMMYQGTWLKSFWAQLFLFVFFVGGAVGATLYFEKKGAWR